MATNEVTLQDTLRFLALDAAFNEGAALYDLWRGRQAGFEARVEDTVNKAVRHQCGQNGAEPAEKERLKQQIIDQYVQSQNAQERAWRLPFPTVSLMIGLGARIINPVTSRLLYTDPTPDTRRGVTPSLTHLLFGQRTAYQYDPVTYENVSDKVLGKETEVKQRAVLDSNKKPVIENGRPVTEPVSRKVYIHPTWKTEEIEVPSNKKDAAGNPVMERKTKRTYVKGRWENVPVVEKYSKTDGVEKALVGKPKFKYDNIQCGNGAGGPGSGLRQPVLQSVATPANEGDTAPQEKIDFARTAVTASDGLKLSPAQANAILNDKPWHEALAESRFVSTLQSFTHFIGLSSSPAPASGQLAPVNVGGLTASVRAFFSVSPAQVPVRVGR